MLNTIIDTTSFTINSGVSTRTHFYSRGGSVNRAMDVIIDEPLSYSNLFKISHILKLCCCQKNYFKNTFFKGIEFQKEIEKNASGQYTDSPTWNYKHGDLHLGNHLLLNIIL